MEFIYKNLKGTLETRRVTDAEIDRQLEKLRQQTPRYVDVVGRAAQNGDEVILDYKGISNGVQFDGGTAENQKLTLGSGMFIPGFEEQLVGHNVGDEVVVEVTFPEQYHAENLAGQPAQFHCKLHAIRKQMEYEMDDTFAKEVGQCNNMDEMRLKMAESLRQYYDDRAEMDLQDQLIRQAAMTLDFAPTEEEVEAAIDAQLQTMEAQLNQRGLTLEAYCQFTGATTEQLRQDARPDAESSLRIQLAARRIADLENLQAEDADIAKELAAVCRQNGMTMEQLRPYYNAEFETAVKQNIRLKKAIQFVRDHGDITKVTAKDE